VYDSSLANAMEEIPYYYSRICIKGGFGQQYRY
jgi:hypothetical protein